MQRVAMPAVIHRTLSLMGVALAPGTRYLLLYGQSIPESASRQAVNQTGSRFRIKLICPRWLVSSSGT